VQLGLVDGGDLEEVEGGGVEEEKGHEGGAPDQFVNKGLAAEVPQGDALIPDIITIVFPIKMRL
jgi:hypothetical protein